MGKLTKIIIISIFVFLIGLVLVLNYLLYSAKKKQQANTNEKEDEEVIQEYKGKVIQGEQRRLVKFIKVEGNRIIVEEKGEEKQYPLTEKEVVLLCTGQSIGNEAKLNYDQINSIKPISSPEKLNDLIFEKESLILILINDSGIQKVQSIASERCIIDNSADGLNY